MNIEPVIYHSENDKSSTEALHYSKTNQSTHRYLAYRDIPLFTQKYIRGKKALDYGTGTGISAQYLQDLGYDVTGVDVSKEMLLQAKTNYPDLPFHQIQDQKIPLASDSFHLIFSSFVLFEMGKEEEIVAYLEEAKRVLKNDGVFIAVTGSQDLHSTSKDWVNFRTDFPENENPSSGDLVKLFLNDFGLEFNDYYWTEVDYRLLFAKAGLELLEVHYPLGESEGPYQWKDEKSCSPFVIFVAKK